MKMADMKRIIISIVLGVWALVSYSQVVEENPPSQTLSSLMDEQSKKEVKRSVKSFVLSVGPAWNVSKVYTSQGARTSQAGMELMAEYNHIYSKGFGFGLTLAYNTTKYPVDGRLNQLFVGPSLVYAGHIGKKWWAKVDVGIGYGNCHGDYDTTAGYSEKTGISINYMLSPSIGIGTNLLFISTFLADKEESLRKDEINGVARVGLTLGLRVFL